MYGLFEMPEQRLIDQQIKTLATVEMVDKPAPLLSLMQKGYTRISPASILEHTDNADDRAHFEANCLHRQSYLSFEDG